jgi:hypothetical protein
MKDFLKWIEEYGIVTILIEIGIGLYVLISFVSCALKE